MTIFVDTANAEEVRKWVVEYGVGKGVTSNQKIFLQEKDTNFETRIKEIIKILPSCYPVSIELTKTDCADSVLIEEATYYKTLEKDTHHGIVVIKVPMWGDGRGLRIAKQLYDKHIPVNLTCCMSINQAILACELDVKFVSFFYRRIIDYEGKKHYVTEGMAPEFESILLSTRDIISKTKKIIDTQGYKTKIICGSIRQPEDVEECFIAGAHIVTITPQVLEKLPCHPKTEETIKEFDECWIEFTKKNKQLTEVGEK